MLSIIFPTRNRPENLVRFHKSLVDTCNTMPEVVVYVDDDDKVSIPVADKLGFKYSQGPRHALSQCYNEASALATGDLLMYGGDDLVFRTPNWDVIVADEFAQRKIILVHGDDQCHGTTRAATHGILHRKWVEATGYFVPPYFESWFDMWLTDIANELNVRVCLPFINEHMHFTVCKAEYDKTYSDAKYKQYEDKRIYPTLTSQRQAYKNRIKRLIKQEGEVQAITA